MMRLHKEQQRELQAAVKRVEPGESAQRVRIPLLSPLSSVSDMEIDQSYSPSARKLRGIEQYR
eukprot:5656129-Pyramimonas_sp.AAC.1